LLSPGDRVDIQVFVKTGNHNGTETGKSKVILQNIRVFAVDQTVQRSRDGGDETASIHVDDPLVVVMPRDPLPRLRHVTRA